MSRRTDLAWGIRWGLAAAAFYVASSIVGAFGYDHSGFGQLGPARTVLPPVLLISGIGGILVGVCLGLVRPLFATRRGAIIGAALVGVVDIPATTMIVRYGVSNWRGDLVIAPIIGVVFGGAYGAAWWSFRRYKTRRKTA